MSSPRIPAHTLSVLLFTLFLLAVFIPAAGASTLKPNDILNMETPGHFTLSADGDTLIYIRSTGTDLAPPANNGTLMYIDVTSATELPLTTPEQSVTAYALSPDGKTVVYAAMPREGGPVSLYLLHLPDRNATRLSEGTDEIGEDFAFLGTDHLVFTGAPGNATASAYDDVVIVVDELPEPVILKTYALTDGEIAPLSANTDVITIWEPSPDGRYVLYKASPNPRSWETGAPFRYAILDTLTGEEQELFTSVEGYQDENQFAWSPDSTVVYIERFINGGLRYPVEDASDLLVYTPATQTLEEVPLTWDRGLFIDLFNSDIEVNPFNGGAYLFLADGTNPKLARVTRAGGRWQMSFPEGRDTGNIYAAESDRTGATIVYNYNTPCSPPQLYRATVSGNEIQDPVLLTGMNQALMRQDLGTSDVTTWKGAQGDTISGIIRYPPGYEKGTAYPLVLVIHGGPNYADFDSWRDTWEFPYHLITDRGAVTLSVNYHGSTNFGLDFARSIEGGYYYDLPTEDLLTGIDHLAEQGIINRSQVGVTGWSNGGILTLALITKDPTLKAAISGAGTADENSQIANTNGIVMDRMYYEKSPYQDPGAFQQILPLYQAKNVKTPLLMMIGTDDPQVNPASAWVTYRAYKEESQAPVRFVLFKDQPHHMTTPETQARKVEEELDWLDQYLFSSLPAGTMPIETPDSDDTSDTPPAGIPGMPAGTWVVWKNTWTLFESGNESEYNDILEEAMAGLAENQTEMADFSNQSWSEAFLSLNTLFKERYAYTGWRAVDFDALYREYAPQIAHAEEQLDEAAYYRALREYLCDFPDGHVNVIRLSGEYGAREADIGGSYGIGIIELDSGQVIVSYVACGSAAEAAGIRFGDEVLAWNGVEIHDAINETSYIWATTKPSTAEGIRLHQGRLLTRAPVGTTATISLDGAFDAGSGSKSGPRTVNLTAICDGYDDLKETSFFLGTAVNDYGVDQPFFDILPQIADTTVTSRTLPGEYAYIAVYEESYGVYEQFQAAMREAIACSAPGIVLDLRFNNGGDENLAACMASWFVDEPVFYEYATTYDSGTGTFPIVCERWSSPHPEGYKGPVAVLVSPDTISSGEGVPMIISKTGRGKVISWYGTNGAFGMVNIQAVMPTDTYIVFPDGASLNETGIIQIDSDVTMTGGVSPDIRVPLTKETVARAMDGEDVQLTYALEWLEDQQ